MCVCVRGGALHPMYCDVYLVNDSINREVEDVEAIHLTMDCVGR